MLQKHIDSVCMCVSVCLSLSLSLPLSLVLCFGGTGAWSQGFALAKQVSYYLSNTSNNLWLFWRWRRLMNYLPGLAWNSDLPDLSFQIAGITGVSHWCQVILMHWTDMAKWKYCIIIFLDSDHHALKYYS
jgi:hypothetical protein